MNYLGIDAGASATKWALYDGAQIIASGKLAPMDGHIYRPESKVRMQEVLAEITSQINATEVAGVFAGLTGVAEEKSSNNPISQILQEHFPNSKVRVVQDIVLAYYANFEVGDGILLYAGTGSIAMYIDDEAGPVRAGGWGYLLGDEGGGFWIGREAIRWVLAGLDTGEEVTPGSLSEVILQEINASDWNGIKEFVYSSERSEIAKLSATISRLADEGDSDAQGIIFEASQFLIALIHQLDIQIENAPQIVIAGGVCQPGSYLAKSLTSFFSERISISECNIAERAAELAIDI
jgi:N-acetylglucosamine kinase-like BadF-type ATPase